MASPPTNPSLELAPRPGERPWQHAQVGRHITPEVADWLVFSTLRSPGSKASIRALLASYDLFAASEGHPVISQLDFVRGLERLGLVREGGRLRGLRLHAEIPPIRLLTRMQIYGFRFAMRDGELTWQHPEVVLDHEWRTISEHRESLIEGLRCIARGRARILGLDETRLIA